MRRNLVALIGAVVVMALAAVVFSLADGTGDSSPAASDAVESGAVESGAVETEAPRFSDLPTIDPGELPDEAIVTLQLIAVGGPFPYRQDDGVFQNREGILPDRPEGHYREYTVDTPGSDDRGARRLVSGADGELYYTDDHYDSFREVITR